MFNKFKIKILKTLILFFKGKLYYARHIGVSIGHNNRIYISDWGTEPFLISIGNNVTITEGVKFITHDGSNWLFKDEKGRRFLYRKITVGSNVFIGVNTIILPGVTIENNVIVAAGSVVTKSIPSGSIVGGNPAKIIGKYNDLEQKALNEYVTKTDMKMNLNYKERILKIVDKKMKSFLDEKKKK